MVAAMEKANYDSIRGKFQFNVNHHPIEDFYLLKGVKEPNGDVQMHIVQKVFEKHKDAYWQQCKMK
jgi:branched-chain amino acid transport system substrate-binding protein